MAETVSSEWTNRAVRRQSRRSQRIRTACLRCQQRKIRCDGTLPKCASCSKSKKNCEYQDGNTVDNQARARYTQLLEQRVRWLECIVKDRCPDVDLLQDIGAEFDDNNDASMSTFNDQSAERDHVPDVHHAPVTDIDASNIVQDPPPITENSRDNNIGTSRGDSNDADSSMAHQIGLVSLPNGDDPRYIGPSSGHFFTQLVCTVSALTKTANPIRLGVNNATLQRDSALTERLLRDIQTPLPSSKETTQELTKTYFKTVHQHSPFLHEPTHMKLVEEMYAMHEPDPVVAFQVYMVLAIASVTLSRRDRIVLPSEGWYTMAISYFEKVPLESSTRGLQCLLLLYIWGMHSPSTKLNVWYLNYQCIAMVVDLGLQRDVTATLAISPIDQEMRTRIFWVVYSLDRSLCTMMGRPIGLRDEACDLRLPADVDDRDLARDSIKRRPEDEPPNHMTYGIHMFKLAKLNSEMKYILHSISRDTPAYAYPAIRCMNTWQRDMASRLDQWAADIPNRSTRDYAVKLCEVRYHVLKTLLLRPSPGIPQPSSDDLRGCCKSAISAVRLYHELYIENSLVFSWACYHSIMMSSVTAFFCIWTCPAVAQDTVLDELVSDLRAASNILSATGEHWPGAKRSRDILDELSHRTISWMMDRKNRDNGENQNVVPARNGDIAWSDLNENTLTGLQPTGDTSAHLQTNELEALMQQYSRNWTPGLDLLPPGLDQVSDPNTGLWTGDMNTDMFLQDLFDGLAPMSF